MLDRVQRGDVPPKHHLAHRDAAGALRYEECLTRTGFDGPYSILYHLNRPHALTALPANEEPLTRGAEAVGVSGRALARRHFRTSGLARGNTPADSRTVLLTGNDLSLSSVKASAGDRVYSSNADADEVLFVRSGKGIVRSVFGDLAFGPGDYVCIPKGTVHRLVLDGDDLEAFAIECTGVGIPKQWRNEVGQLRMDAPYCHRDFRRPEFVGPMDEGFRELVVKRHGVRHHFRYEHSPLDVVGWDGTVYPWAFPILAFQPRVSSVHLPPTWHGTFSAHGVLICSFVPRPLDFHPSAVPCPYPHSSVDVDEVIYYVSGEFGSRSGIEVGSLTLHPAGMPHGPHPGRYEGSVGAKYTDEVAVMLDCYSTLRPTTDAARIEDARYDASFISEKSST
jgi:homogentisate 1,2-dioxygenase